MLNGGWAGIFVNSSCHDRETSRYRLLREQSMYIFLKSNEAKKMGNNICNSNLFLRRERNVERFVPRVSLAKIFISFDRLNFVGSKWITFD